ncbi:MAG: serine hydrolase domain-containing protein [Nocardioides sp.]
MRPPRHVTLVASCLAALLLAGCTATSPPSGPEGADAAPVPSGVTSRADDVGGWPTASPAAMGFRTKRLARLAREAKQLDSSCYAVVRKGRLVGDWNWGADRNASREVFSVTKSVTSALVGIALRDGSLELDDRVSRYVRAWRGTDSARVTVRQLLANDSGRFWSLESDYVTLGQAGNRTGYAVGLDQQHAPGSAWAYNNAAIQVLDRVLSRATGMTTADFAAERLFGPLGMTHTRMTPDSSGRSTNTYFGLQTTCLDLARFALLYLQQGAVDGQQLLTPGYVEASVGRSSTEHNAAYGHLWWLNRSGPIRGATDAVDAAGQPLTPREGQLVPDAPESLYAAIGLAGQIVMVDPRSGTLVVRLGAASEDDEPYGLPQAAQVVTWALR